MAHLGDHWFESEPPIAAGLARELRRVGRRAAARPLRVLVIAALLTTAVVHRIAIKAPVVEAEVILALSEEALADGRASKLPAVELREYVSTVLMSDRRLLDIVERWDLHPLRARLGPEYAIAELRAQIEIAVWKNTFAYYDLEEADHRKSARIGITVLDHDGRRATAIAGDLARAVIAAHEAAQRTTAEALSRQAAAIRDRTERELEALAIEISSKQAAIARAQDAGKRGLASALMVDVIALARREHAAEIQLAQIASSRDTDAGAIAAAGLDVSMRIVEERRPRDQDRESFVLLLGAVVVASGTLLGTALVVGAFDPSIHAAGDLERLGLRMIGEVP